MRKIKRISIFVVLWFAFGLSQVFAKEYYKGGASDFPRKALIGTDCVINQFVNVVDVFSGSSNLSNLMDEDLSNYASISGVAFVGAVEDPVIQIKDRKYYYAGGTKAGFCVQAGGGESSILSLDILQHVTIAFYKDGKMVGDPVPVEEGQDAGVLRLGLIQIPGEEEGASFFTATSPGDFDEIALFNGGVTASVVGDFKIRYAYVGNPIEYALTKKNVSDVRLEKGWNSKILKDEEHFTDKDTTNYTSQAKIAVDLGATLTLSWGKEYPAGMEVGFLFEDAGLNIAVGANSRIILENSQGDQQEVLLQGSVLGLNLGGVIRKVSITAEQSFNKATLSINGLEVTFGERKFYYGFVTYPTEVPHHNDLGLTMNTLIGQDVTGYTLTASKPANWSVESLPDDETGNVSITPGPSEMATVSGMTANVQGDYVFKAVSADGCGCEGIVTLTRGVKDPIPEECRKPISGNNIGLSTEIHESSGSLLSWSNVSNRENIVDDDMNTYAEYVAGLSLAENLHIVGIKRNDGTIWGGGDDDLKVGFVMEASSSLLDLNLLQFFRIRLYKNGYNVYEKVVDETDVLSLGLVGKNQMAKVRYSIEVPKTVEFDEITLWKSGVLSLGLSNVRIYGVFMNSVALGCYDSPLSCGSVVLNAEETGTYFNYDKTGFEGLVQAGAFMKDLENVIDNDPQMETCATIGGVNVGVKWTVAINLGRVMGKANQFGLVMDEKTYLAVADVIGAMNVALYRNGKKIQEQGEWGLIGVSAIGYGDKRYIFMNPVAEYDEVRITNGGLVNLNVVSIYGIVVRDDQNGNGIPDCSEDPNIMNVSVTSDICEGDVLTVIGSDVAGKKYLVSSNDILGNTVIPETEVSVDDDGDFLWKFKPEKIGKDYKLTIKEVENTGLIIPQLVFTVHPKQTTWKNKNTSTDWNAWDNWSAGSPWTCTDVIIPTDASVYPVLESGVLNGCHYIHFEPNTEVVNTHYLTYTKAWVEMALNPNRYYMVSVPLKSVYSGDWFLPKVELTSDKTVTQENINSSFTVPYFTDLNETTLPANRVQPTVFQRVWEKTVLNRLPDTGQAPVYPTYASTNWTKPYNWLATPYDKADGYDFNALSVWVHPFRADFTNDDPSVSEDLSYKFRFPKEHTQYFYYDEEGNIRSESARLTRKNVGRFIYEQDDQTAKFPITMRYKNEGFGEDHQVFLVGNPFMTHINVAKLFEGNGHIWSIKVYDGNTYISVIKKEDGTLSSLEEYASIAPMQSFFVEISSEDEENDECAITYTEDMLGSSPGTDLLRSVRGAAGGNIFRLTASAAGKEAGALLRFSASASDYYRDGEDADLLIDDEVPPVVALFTLAGERAVDIQQRANGGEIPLGFFLAKPEEMTLRLDVPEQCAGWTLVDAANGKAYPLEVGLNEIELGRMTTNVGRFALRGDLPTGNGVITASQPRIYCYREEGGTLVVRSVEGLMTQCEVYTVAGQLLGMARHETNEYRLPVASGAKIIRVTFADGISSTIKTF